MYVMDVLDDVPDVITAIQHIHRNLRHTEDFKFISSDGNLEFRCHSLIAAIHSWILCEKIYGSSCCRYIKIEGAGNIAIENMIRYFYQEDVIFESVFDITETKKLADAYEIPELGRICVKQLANINLNLSNVISVLTTSMEFNDTVKESECLLFISENKEAVFISQPFIRLTFENVLDIFLKLRDRNFLSELEFLLSGIKWLETTCSFKHKNFLMNNIDVSKIPLNDYLDIIVSSSEFFSSTEISYAVNLIRSIPCTNEQIKNGAESIDAETSTEIRMICKDAETSTEIRMICKDAETSTEIDICKDAATSTEISMLCKDAETSTGIDIYKDAATSTEINICKEAATSIEMDIIYKNAETSTEIDIKCKDAETDTKEQMNDFSAMKLCRKVHGILNNLTTQKFETSVKQIKNLNINTEEKLNGVVDLIYEKAIAETNCVLYANMCKHLCLISVPLHGQPGEAKFRKLLLKKCQVEFETFPDKLKCEERIKAIESADPEKRKELQLKFDEDKTKMKMRQLGNIRLIGELYKLNMLIEPIIHECIIQLLTESDEEALECLCCLLKGVGKELDEKSESSSMDQYFAQMQKIIDECLTSSKVRFMLQDVIDLKKNNWIPENWEAEREAREPQRVFQNKLYVKRLADASQKISGRKKGVSEDSWPPASKSNKSSYSIIDYCKLQLTKPDKVDIIRIGPGGRGPQSWGKGSCGGNRTTIASDIKTALTNRYSALADQSLTPAIENRKASQRCPALADQSLTPAFENTGGSQKYSALADRSLTTVLENRRGSQSIEEIKTKLRELLTTYGENEVIFDWIDANFPPHAVSEFSFIRALSEEVYKVSIIDVGGEYKLDEYVFKKRLPLLCRYIGHNEKLELQALYAVQHLMYDLNQPKGVLRMIFDMLYDDAIIDEESFKVWEQSKDPSELEGKDVALLSVRGFFTWLREADSGEDSDDE